MDDKYDILKHPNVALTTDGKTQPYLHGGTENAVATVSFVSVGSAADAPSFDETETIYELLSDEDLEAFFNSQEESQHEKRQ